MDAIVITEYDTYPGVKINCRVIGAWLATQKSSREKAIRNDRFFFIPEDTIIYIHIKDIKEFSKSHVRQLQEFFINYNKAENNESIPLKFINAVQSAKLLGKELH